MPTYDRLPVSFTHGEGAWFWDVTAETVIRLPPPILTDEQAAHIVTIITDTVYAFIKRT